MTDATRPPIKIIFDTDIDWGAKLSFVGSDNREAGRLAGGHIAKVLSGKGKVAVIRGILGIRTHDDRCAQSHAACARRGRGEERVLPRPHDPNTEPPRNGQAGLVAADPARRLVGDTEEGVFAERTAFSRMRVQGAFRAAVAEATDAPPPKFAAALGRLLYLLHLSVILWWLLDRSPRQRATRALMRLLERVLPSAALMLKLPSVRGFVNPADRLFEEGLLAGHVDGPRT